MTQLFCEKCNACYSPEGSRWRCECGHFLDLKYNTNFPIEKINKRSPNMWRYREAIPLKSETEIISYQEGFSPLLKVGFGNNHVLIKQEQLFPTGSFKDRGSSVLISKVKSLGIQEVVADSSGNAGSSIAAYCAIAGIKCHIYVPENTSAGKLTQISMYGAHLHKIPGSREDTAKAVLEAAEKIYYASHYWNPFFFQGTKTLAYEICEQLSWSAPDTIILPVGNGSLLIGVYTGFSDLYTAGIIKNIPKIIGIQPVNCAPLADAFHNQIEDIPHFPKKDTIAEGIAIASPIRGKQIINAVKKTNGSFITVSELEIKHALIEICQKGFYIEPTSAATVAGIKKYLQIQNQQKRKVNHQQDHLSNEIVVSVFTGHGLKAGNKISEL